MESPFAKTTCDCNPLFYDQSCQEGKKLTREELGKLVGVQKSQISKLEGNATTCPDFISGGIELY